MSWASERCKPQFTSLRCRATQYLAIHCAPIPCRATLRRSTPCPASLHLLQNRAKLRSAAFRLLSPRITTHRSTIVPSSRLKLGLNSFRRCTSREGETSALRCFASHRLMQRYNLSHICPSLRDSPPNHRSRVTIKPCSPSAALRGEAGVSPRYALPLIAAHCSAHPRCALHRSPIVPGLRSKPGLVLRIAMPCLVTQFHAKSRHRLGLTIKALLTISSPTW